jgi:acyl-CoA synthetase (AMP-forming)/AMP-acid ligase II
VHVSAQWGVFQTLFGGGTAVLTGPGPIDPAAVWSTVAAERVNVLTVVGDAMARPLLDFLASHPGQDDLGTLLVFASGGAVLSPSSKEQIATLLPGVITIDGYGSTETGVSGSRARFPGAAVDESVRIPAGDSARVVDDDFRPVEPGSGTVGQLVRRGRLPLGYHGDPEKTAATFVTVDGVRWARSGDAATVEPDGTIVLLGRGSVSINTGGEKVYPEEVEQVIKAHPAVFDAVVVGAPDERWGERVVAVVATRAHDRIALDELQSHCRARLAGYKVPRALVEVDTVERSPTGKPDYAWARRVAGAARGDD